MKSADDLLPLTAEGLVDIPRDKPALVAVSGGCDSVVLLHLLQRAGFLRLIVAHFHHGLRGASADHDAAFVKTLAVRLGLTFVGGRGDTRARARKHGESQEEAARALRRAFLARTARKHDATVIFLAHHANDAAETILFHLARGGGTRGLSALRPRSPLDNTGLVLVRPLLPFRRSEIENYAAANQIAFCTDETNASRTHTRNRLRQEVVPALAQAVGFDPVPPMARAASILAAEDDWLESLVAEEAALSLLDTRAIASMHPARQRRLLRAWLQNQIGLAVDSAVVERAKKLATTTATPAKINLPAGRHLRRRAGKLFVETP